MLRRPMTSPRRVLLTLDAVGGVWRYALDVARGLERNGVSFLLAGFGPPPDAAQQAECGDLANAELVWSDVPLDWMVAEPAALRSVSEQLATLAREWDADLLHLNLPSQAADLDCPVPVAVAAHSCVPTWWQAVRGTRLPEAWQWQLACNRAGFDRADAVFAPSAAHAAALRRCYGRLPAICVVPNATSVSPGNGPKEMFVLAAARWWDDGKNGAVLDEACIASPVPIRLAGPLHGPNGEHRAFHHAQALGPLPHAEVVAMMRKAAIFAAPSRYEPFGLAVAEAAICGAALVLADIPTFRELWEDAALFVPATDAGSWAEAFARLAADRAFRARLAGAAQSRASRFTPRRQADSLFEKYLELTARIPAGAVA
jgi:hypothetical protein